MVKLKNIVIWSLIIVNVFFLAFFLGRIIKEHSIKKEALTHLSVLFERNGIELDAENIREGGELAELLITRDPTEERKLAETLLGPVDMTENGGIYTYTGEKGQAVFRSGGAFDIQFSEHVYDSITGARNTAKSILQTMGIETAAPVAVGDKGNETVEAVCSWERQPIFNCRIRFIFKDGSLAEIRGTYAATIKAAVKKTDMSSCATSMMYFLNDVKNDRISCVRIWSVEPGYMLKAAGDVISAVWCVDTDNGVYYVDAGTGNIERETQ
ncbi:MAG: hypothetical protein GX847_02605 [Clostridiales bacterium]|nr:hypothetical protein [Clostridiales bacterium]